MKSADICTFFVIATLALGGCSEEPETSADTDRVEAAPLGCGSWKRAHFDDPEPPPDAEAYGNESNSAGYFSQYVCRFMDTVDGQPVVLQGKGVFGFSCYAVLPREKDFPLRVQSSKDFDVLAGTKDCARMVPYEPTLRLLPTGLDADGNPTFSCRGIVNNLDMPGKSAPLGRFDPLRQACIFEWHLNVRAAPTFEEESFEVLAVL